VALTETPRHEPVDGGRGVAAVHACGQSAAHVVHEVMAELAEEPRVLECDLAGLLADGSTIAEQFTPVGHYLQHWRGTVVLIHVPDPDLRCGLASAQYAETMIIHADRDGDTVDNHRLLPHLRQTRMLLRPEPTAPAVARAFVTHTMQDWQLPRLIDPANRVVSEFVSHAASGGDAGLEVRLSQVDTRIRIAMKILAADTSAALINMPESPLTGRARQLVQTMADGWGVIPGRPAGATVWAVINASGVNDPDDVNASRREHAAARHRGAPDTDVLTELHHRTVGRHRGSRKATADHSDADPDLSSLHFAAPPQRRP
jgi:hypothetical protein